MLNQSLANYLENNNKCYLAYNIYFSYILLLLNLHGLGFNTLTILVYIKLMRKKQARGTMHKFLLSESIFETYLTLHMIIFNKSNTFAINLYNIRIHAFICTYLFGVSIWMSILCKIGACFSRFRQVSLKPMSVSSFKSIFTLMLTFSIVIYTWNIYYRWRFKDEAKDFLFNLRFINSLVENVLILSCVFTLNIWTMIRTREYLNKKRIMLMATNDVVNARLMMSVRVKISKAKMNISWMMFISGLIDCLGYGLSFSYYLARFVDHSFHHNWFHMCFFVVIDFAETLMIITNFHIYIVFNKSFRKCFATIIVELFRII